MILIFGVRMREVYLTKTGAQKIYKGDYELFNSDFDISFRPTPGEWVVLVNTKNKLKYYACLNEGLSGKRPSLLVIQHLVINEKPETIIENNLTRAYQFKKEFFGDCFRLSHGGTDNLPSVVIDCYSNCSLIQIKSFGLDNYRNHIKEVVSNLTGNESFFLDDKKFREEEGMPIFECEEIPSYVEIEENEIKYKISKDVMQKNGYYFDHRLNRSKAANLVNQNRSLQSGKTVDLFSYVGSWGLNLLKKGCTYIEFVDQGDFTNDIKENLQLNDWSDKGTFIRQDVFKFLDEKAQCDEKYKIICCDPPAFCKSIKKKRNAIDGYKKLINKCIKIADEKSIINFGSCTKYVDIIELMELFKAESIKNNRKVSLLDIGTQGGDHTNTGFTDKSNYIKYLAYYVE